MIANETTLPNEVKVSKYTVTYSLEHRAKNILHSKL